MLSSLKKRNFSKLTPEGFSNSLKVDITTANSSPSSGHYLVVTTRIEGQDLQHLNFGSSGAKETTISFWVKSNKTGNASFNARQSDNSDKLFSAQYSISSADTWEHKTISIPADTSGVINNDTGNGIQLEWWLHSGSTFTGGSHAATWITNDHSNRNSTNLGVGGSTDDEFYITGIQWEVGEKAARFEHRSYSDQLARCQRYYYRHADRASDEGRSIGTFAMYQSSRCFGAVHFPVTMRATPTLDVSDFTNAFKCFANANNQGFDSFAGIQETGTTNCVIESDNTLSLTAAAGAWVRCEGSSSQLSFNAEI